MGVEFQEHPDKVLGVLHSLLSRSIANSILPSGPDSVFRSGVRSSEYVFTGALGLLGGRLDFEPTGSRSELEAVAAVALGEHHPEIGGKLVEVLRHLRDHGVRGGRLRVAEDAPCP